MENKFKVKIENLNYSYGKDYILQDINVSFPPNKISAIYGESGSGKTTLLNIMSLLFREFDTYSISGKVSYNNSEGIIDLLSIKSDFWMIRRKIVYIAQEPDPLHMSIMKNVEFPMKLIGIRDRDVISERVRNALERVHLYNDVKNRMNDSALGLSGGQKQRLCIARALVLQPDVLLLDEPTSSLDSDNRDRIEKLIVELALDNTIIVVSHDLRQIEDISHNIFECRDRGLYGIFN